MNFIAQKKPLQVTAFHYNNDTCVNAFLEYLRSNSSEGISYDETDHTVYIHKKRGEIALPLGNWLIYEGNTDKAFWSIEPTIFKETYDHVAGEVYQKKVYQVQAIELTSLASHHVRDVLSFMQEDASDETIKQIQEQGYILINTLEGPEALYPTEILIKGVKGEFYPVARENFDKVYTIIERG